jgi:phage terminase large subunit-like protein
VVPAGAIVRKNVTEGWYELANGSRFWLLGLDADPVTGVPSKVGSLDLAFAFVDEAVELVEADWMMLGGRLRFPDVPFTQIAGATNPADPKHWLIQRFRDGKGELLQASTTDNRFLPASYLERMAGMTGIYRERYVKGEWISISGGLFDPAWIKVDGRMPQMQRIVIAVDPAVTSGKSSDETGIVVAGLDPSGHGWIMADLSGRMTPDVWAERVISAYREFKADRIIGEVNNGGDLVGRNIRIVDPMAPYHSVVASRGKITRAEPIANLYGIGRVSHAQDFPELVSQMIGYDGKGSSPDRMDAMVWALTELMLDNPWAGYGNEATPWEGYRHE